MWAFKYHSGNKNKRGRGEKRGTGIETEIEVGGGGREIERSPLRGAPINLFKWGSCVDQRLTGRWEVWQSRQGEKPSVLPGTMPVPRVPWPSFQSLFLLTVLHEKAPLKLFPNGELVTRGGNVAQEVDIPTRKKEKWNTDFGLQAFTIPLITCQSLQRHYQQSVSRWLQSYNQESMRQTVEQELNGTCWRGKREEGNSGFCKPR